jgi:hypothetical protein
MVTAGDLRGCWDDEDDLDAEGVIELRSTIECWADHLVDAHRTDKQAPQQLMRRNRGAVGLPRRGPGARGYSFRCLSPGYGPSGPERRL